MSGHCVFISGLTPITDRWVQLGILHSLCATIDLEWKKSLYWVVKHCRSSPFVGHSDFSSSHVTNATSDDRGFPPCPVSRIHVIAFHHALPQCHRQILEQLGDHHCCGGGFLVTPTGIRSSTCSKSYSRSC